ncbi:MAG: STAS domain-containing protein [Candidatus Nanopelagicales bacterium]
MHIERGPGWSRAELAGEIDLAWVTENADLYPSLTADEPTMVILGVASVTFADSSALGLISSLLRYCDTNNGQVFIVRPSQQLEQILSFAGMRSLLQLVLTPEQEAALPLLIEKVASSRTVQKSQAISQATEPDRND